MTSRLRELSDEIRKLEETLREGGGGDRIAKQHKQGKLTARERIGGLCDPESRFIEVGLLVAYDQYDGQAPGAGVVTTRAHAARNPDAVAITGLPAGSMVTLVDIEKKEQKK